MALTVAAVCAVLASLMMTEYLYSLFLRFIGAGPGTTKMSSFRAPKVESVPRIAFVTPFEKPSAAFAAASSSLPMNIARMNTANGGKRVWRRSAISRL